MESKNTMVIAALLVGILLGGAIGYTMMPPKEVEVEVPGETQTVEVKVPALSGVVKLGLILPTASNAENLGVATTLALEDLNAYVEDLGLNLTFEIIAESADGDAALALEKLQGMIASGVEAVVGSMYSSQLGAMQNTADESHVVLFSEGSTAPQLAIADDYIYRLVITDKFVNDAVARVMYERGLRHIIVTYKDNAYGVGAKDALVESFEALGGTVEEVMPYIAESVEFSGLAAGMNDEYSTLVSTYGEDEIGIAVFAQNEIVPIMSALLEYPSLQTATYYSNDGFMRSEELIDEVAGIEDPRIICLSMGLIKNEKFEAVELRYMNITGRDQMSTYYANAYDIVQILGRAILEAGKYDGETIKTVIPEVCNNYFGITGWAKLNEYGDRAVADYEMYTIEYNGTASNWLYAGMFSSATNTANWAYTIE